MPAFVFAEHARQGMFGQLSAALRRRGYRTIHVTTARPLWINRLISRLMYDRSLFVTSAELQGLAEPLADEDVRDIQNTEYVLEDLARGDVGTMSNGIGERVNRRAELLDKFAAGKLCIQSGIPVPEKLDAMGCSPRQAIAVLGLPLVVKAKVGASGLGVRIVSTEAAVGDALLELGPADNLFYERYIDGDYVDYSAVAGLDGPIQEVVTRTVTASATAPPSSIETVDDPGLLDVGRQAVRALGLEGFIHIDAVRDTEGRYWLIDINLRAWGSMISLRRAGIDFTEGYLTSLGLCSGMPASVSGAPAVTLTAFTGVVDEQISRGSVIGTLAAYLRHAPPFVRLLGLRYGAAQLLASMVGVAAHLVTNRKGAAARG